MRVKIFDLSWNVDLNRLENEINIFLAMLPGNAVKHVQSAASSTRTRDTDQMQTDYLVTVWYEGEPKKPAGPRNQRGGEIQIRAISRTETRSHAFFRSGLAAAATRGNRQWPVSFGRLYETNKIVIFSVANCAAVGFRKCHCCVTSTLIGFLWRKRNAY
jgi:hypothetical protein